MWEILSTVHGIFPTAGRFHIRSSAFGIDHHGIGELTRGTSPPFPAKLTAAVSYRNREVRDMSLVVVVVDVVVVCNEVSSTMLSQY